MLPQLKRPSNRVLTEAAMRDIVISRFLLSPSVIYIEIVYNKKKESKPCMSLDLDLRAIFCLKESILCSILIFENKTGCWLWNALQFVIIHLHQQLEFHTKLFIIVFTYHTKKKSHITLLVSQRYTLWKLGSPENCFQPYWFLVELPYWLFCFFCPNILRRSNTLAHARTQEPPC